MCTISTFRFATMCTELRCVWTWADLSFLLNLDDLYESLYDALNQYFSMWNNKKFVDLGLGTHRVKAFVHDNFRYLYLLFICKHNYTVC